MAAKKASKKSPAKKKSVKKSSSATQKTVAKPSVDEKPKISDDNKEVVSFSIDNRILLGVSLIILVVIFFLIGNGSSFSFFSGKQAGPNSVVSLYYVGTLDDGSIFDTNRQEIADANDIQTDGQVLVVPINDSRFVRGFRQNLIGLTQGEEKTFTVAAEDAYGNYQAQLVETYSKEEFAQFYENIDELTIGQELAYESPSGFKSILRIKNIGRDFVTVDLNPPLAGKDLVFTVEVVSIE